MSLINFTKALTWTDFPNRLPEPSPTSTIIESATIGVSWSHDIDEFVRKGNAIGIAKYTVTIFITPNNCAVLQSILTAGGAVAAALLKHEQGHYDIIALGAREFHNRMASLTAPTEADLVTMINTLDGQIRSRSTNKDALYDTRTAHSVNVAQQSVWNTSISGQKQNLNGNVDGLPS